MSTMPQGRLTRLMQLLLTYSRLDTGSSVSLHTLAETLGFDVTQVRDDLTFLFNTGANERDALSFVDINLEASDHIQIMNDQGLLGAVQLNQNEIAALYAALASAATDLGTHNELWQELIDQISASNTGAGRYHAGAVQIQDQNPARAQILTELERALAQGVDVTLTYTDTLGNTSRRRIHPVSLHRDHSRAYVQAWCFLAQGQRSFRLDRISDLHVHTDARELPEHLFAQGDLLDLTTVEITLAAPALWAIERQESANVVLTHHDDGSFTTTFRVFQHEWLIRLLLQVSEHIVDAPEQILADIRDYARLLDTLYENDDDGGVLA